MQYDFVSAYSYSYSHLKSYSFHLVLYVGPSQRTFATTAAVEDDDDDDDDTD